MNKFYSYNTVRLSGLGKGAGPLFFCRKGGNGIWTSM